MADSGVRETQEKHELEREVHWIDLEEQERLFLATHLKHRFIDLPFLLSNSLKLPQIHFLCVYLRLLMQAS
jgi:hypothetical protein